MRRTGGIGTPDRRTRRRVPAFCTACAVALLLLQPVGAQLRFTYSKGQSVTPAFEGWMANEDGSFTLHFGYMNSNWLEELDVPIGPDNHIEPGGPDRGQPTHFYPRRNPYLFTIRVPEDFGDRELVWTLTTNGRTERTYASLSPDYAINKHTMSMEIGGDFGNSRQMMRDNLAPELVVEGAPQRHVGVGEVLTLAAIAGDPDNLPPRQDGKPQPGVRPEFQHTTGPGANVVLGADRAGRGWRGAFNPPTSVIPASAPGLRLSWIVYRGPARHVAFEPEQMKTWMDTRVAANSPWSPPLGIPVPPADGRWVVRATFREPGTYVLRAVASDSSLFTYENVTVTVTR